MAGIKTSTRQDLEHEVGLICAPLGVETAWIADGRHNCIELRSRDGAKTGKVYYAKTPSDQRWFNNTLRTVRHKLRVMGLITDDDFAKKSPEPILKPMGGLGKALVEAEVRKRQSEATAIATAGKPTHSEPISGPDRKPALDRRRQIGNVHGYKLRISAKDEQAIVSMIKCRRLPGPGFDYQAGWDDEAIRQAFGGNIHPNHVPRIRRTQVGLLPGEVDQPVMAKSVGAKRAKVPPTRAVDVPLPRAASASSPGPVETAPAPNLAGLTPARAQTLEALLLDALSRLHRIEAILLKQSSGPISHD